MIIAGKSKLEMESALHQIAHVAAFDALTEWESSPLDNGSAPMLAAQATAYYCRVELRMTARAGWIGIQGWHKQNKKGPRIPL